MGRPARTSLRIAALGLTLLGLSVAVYTFIGALGPSQAVLAKQGVTEIDLRTVPPGTAVTVEWHGLPITVLHRTERQLEQLPELEALRLNAKVTTAVPDPDGLIPELRSFDPEYFVVYSWTGNAIQCGSWYQRTFEGDVYHGTVTGGFFEACRGAWHDVTGRLLKYSWTEGGDLPIPPHRLVDGKVKLGPVNDSLLKQWRARK